MGLLYMYKKHTGQVLQVQTCTGYSGDQDVAKQPTIKLQHMFYAAMNSYADIA